MAFVLLYLQWTRVATAAPGPAEAYTQEANDKFLAAEGMPACHGLPELAGTEQYKVAQLEGNPVAMELPGQQQHYAHSQELAGVPAATELPEQPYHHPQEARQLSGYGYVSELPASIIWHAAEERRAGVETGVTPQPAHMVTGHQQQQFHQPPLQHQ